MELPQYRRTAVPLTFGIKPDAMTYNMIARKSDHVVI